MGWQFWKREKSDAELSLERLRTTSAGPTQRPPTRDPAAAGGFTMPVEDVFTITGRGTVVTGRVTSGSVRTGQDVTLTRSGGSTRTVRVTGIETFRKQVDSASTGDNIGLLLADIAREDIARGDTLAG